MWPKAQNEMAGLWPHAAMGPVERMVSHHFGALSPSPHVAAILCSEAGA